MYSDVSNFTYEFDLSNEVYLTLKLEKRRQPQVKNFFISLGTIQKMVFLEPVLASLKALYLD